MTRVLRLLDGGEASALVAAEVDRIARDLHDLTGLCARPTMTAGRWWRSTSAWTRRRRCRMLVGILGRGAEWERATIRQRTRDVLAAKKAAGAQLGRPVSPASQPARTRSRELPHDRQPFTAVADTLNAEGYTTPTGLRWTWRHVQKTRDSLALDDEAAAAP